MTGTDDVQVNRNFWHELHCNQCWVLCSFLQHGSKGSRKTLHNIELLGFTWLFAAQSLWMDFQKTWHLNRQFLHLLPQHCVMFVSGWYAIAIKVAEIWVYLYHSDVYKALCIIAKEGICFTHWCMIGTIWIPEFLRHCVLDWRIQCPFYYRLLYGCVIGIRAVWRQKCIQSRDARIAVTCNLWFVILIVIIMIIVITHQTKL